MYNTEIYSKKKKDLMQKNGIFFDFTVNPRSPVRLNLKKIYLEPFDNMKELSEPNSKHMSQRNVQIDEDFESKSHSLSSNSSK